MGPEKVRFSGSDSEMETRVAPGSDPEMDSDSDDADDAVGVGYVPLSQEPCGEGETEATDIDETLREMRLYLPPPPPPEIDINAETVNEIHLQSIDMDEDDLVLIAESMDGLKEKMNKWKECMEAKGLKSMWSW
uniref:male-enhanced antigen 1 isoform X2 n=1 Tax=Myxine glutinosa TaxID=7769 RepID=UPI00358EADB1